ncbi:hypothetical protein OBBRIDRAFT_787064 [Obba rivulosa]|uniref:Conidiation-specific protein 6 n=1 Tax=Obba rivulosa TaxID=1052685 RepID=A0A8E2DV87_9APHY|nr:hypothetical protein OBBRIDRAFT_787064 [Obba rivulosa]
MVKPEPNPDKVARGLKAAISNSSVAEDAKESAKERLRQMEESSEIDSSEAHQVNVASGHKAALKNPNVSQEAKQHSRQVLNEMK